MRHSYCDIREMNRNKNQVVNYSSDETNEKLNRSAFEKWKIQKTIKYHSGKHAK